MDWFPKGQIFKELPSPLEKSSQSLNKLNATYFENRNKKCKLPGHRDLHWMFVRRSENIMDFLWCLMLNLVLCPGETCYSLVNCAKSQNLTFFFLAFHAECLGILTLLWWKNGERLSKIRFDLWKYFYKFAWPRQTGKIHETHPTVKTRARKRYDEFKIYWKY